MNWKRKLIVLIGLWFVAGIFLVSTHWIEERYNREHYGVEIGGKIWFKDQNLGDPVKQEILVEKEDIERTISIGDTICIGPGEWTYTDGWPYIDGKEIDITKSNDVYYLSVDNEIFSSDTPQFTLFEGNKILKVRCKEHNGQCITLSCDVGLYRKEYILKKYGWYPAIVRSGELFRDYNFAMRYGKENEFIIRVDSPHIILTAIDNGEIIWEYKHYNHSLENPNISRIYADQSGIRVKNELGKYYREIEITPGDVVLETKEFDIFVILFACFIDTYEGITLFNKKFIPQVLGKKR